MLVLQLLLIPLPPCIYVCVLEKHGKEIAAKGEEQDTSIGEIVQAAQDEL